MAKEKTRSCAQCGDTITGRSDKRFCSDQCRFLFHSANRQKVEAPVLKINSVLRKNRTILRSLCPKGKATVRREVMEAMGYDFTTFSSAFTTKRGVYYICYDYAFTPILNQMVEKALIVGRQQYMGRNDPWRYLRDNIPFEDLRYFL